MLMLCLPRKLLDTDLWGEEARMDQKATGALVVVLKLDDPR